MCSEMLPAEDSKDSPSALPLFYAHDDRMNAIQASLFNGKLISQSDQEEASNRTLRWFRLFKQHYQNKMVETWQETINLCTALNFMELLIFNNALIKPGDGEELIPIFFHCAMCGKKLVSRQATQLLCVSAIKCPIDRIDALLLDDISNHQRTAGTLESSQRVLEVTCELLRRLQGCETDDDDDIDLRSTKLLNFSKAVLLESFKLQSSDDHLYAQIELLKTIGVSSENRRIYLQNLILPNLISVLGYDVIVRSSFLDVMRSCFPTMSLGVYEADESDADMARSFLEFLSSNIDAFADLICDDAPTANFGCCTKHLGLVGKSWLFRRDVVSLILATLRSALACCKFIPVSSLHNISVVDIEEVCRVILCCLLKDDEKSAVDDDKRLRTKLFQLIFDHDVSMVEVFGLHLNIVHVMRKHQVEFVLSPHEIFLEFLTGISFDVSLVVDFLTDGNTDFLAYFLQYMKTIQSSMFDLMVWCDKFGPRYRNRVKDFFVSLRNSITVAVEENMFSINLRPLVRKLCALVDALTD